jgi:hypothetical protein
MGATSPWVMPLRVIAEDLHERVPMMVAVGPQTMTTQNTMGVDKDGMLHTTTSAFASSSATMASGRAKFSSGSKRL